MWVFCRHGNSLDTGIIDRISVRFSAHNRRSAGIWRYFHFHCVWLHYCEDFRSCRTLMLAENADHVYAWIIDWLTVHTLGVCNSSNLSCLKPIFFLFHHPGGKLPTPYNHYFLLTTTEIRISIHILTQLNNQNCLSSSSISSQVFLLDYWININYLRIYRCARYLRHL